MRAMLLVIALTATAACTGNSSPLTPTSGSWRLSGTISTVSGGLIAGPIAGPELTVQDGANKGARVTSDSSGRYAFASLEGGRFTMIIEASGFVSVAPVVDLARDLDVNFALRKAGETP